MTAFLVFAAQFAYIFLLGFQQQNVTGKHYALAQFTSLLLGICGYHLTATVALAASGPAFGPVWWAYIAAGPVGISVSMWVHPRLRRSRRDA